jgi:hypothetical protein
MPQLWNDGHLDYRGHVIRRVPLGGSGRFRYYVDGQARGFQLLRYAKLWVDRRHDPARRR